ncbi:MAG: ArnT family glycosyltransferase, partial [Candidatus Kariarchaeaceae archaeon]
EEKSGEFAKIAVLEIGITILTYLFFYLFVAETHLVNIFGLLSLIPLMISFVFAIATWVIAQKSTIQIVSHRFLIFIFASLPVVLLPLSIIFYLLLGSFIRTTLSILFLISLWTLFCNVQLSGLFFKKQKIESKLPMLFVIIILLTSALEYILIVPAGVSGADSATFYFMAVRFSENPTLSSFYYEDPLIPLMNELLNGKSDLNFLTIPNTYVYDRTTGKVYADKSIGAPLVFALSILLFGKNAALYVNVIFGFLTNLVTYFFAKEIFKNDMKRNQIAAISVSALAFNPIHLILCGFTLSDIISEFCIILSLFCILKQKKNKGIRFFLISGASFGYAILTRPTNILIIIPVILLLLLEKPQIITDARLYIYLFTIFVVASPALIYNNLLFGTPLKSQSWVLSIYYEFALQRLAQQIIIYTQEIVWNFGVFIPFAFIGFYVFFRKNQRRALFLLGCIIAVFAPYAFYIYSVGRFMLPVLSIHKENSIRKERN